MTDKADAEWVKADTASQKADVALDKAIKKALYVGREVRWKHGSHYRYGRVIEAFGDRVHVQSPGAQFWIGAFRILWELPSNG